MRTSARARQSAATPEDTGAAAPPAVDAALGVRVQQLAADYGIVKDHLGAALAVLPDAGAEVEELGTERARVEQLDADCRTLVDLLHEAQVRSEVLRALRAEVEAGQSPADLGKAYQARLEHEMQRYHAQGVRQRYARDPHYLDFRSRVWEVTGEGAMPPLTDVLAAEDGAAPGADDEEEFVMGGATHDFRCPLTATLLQHPVTSTVCVHAYSRDAILEYIRAERRHRRAAVCPAAGCRKTLTENTLAEAPALQRRVERFERQQSRRGAQAQAVMLE